MQEKVRITGLSGGLYRVEDSCGETLQCRARGVLRHKNQRPLVGDRVTLSVEKTGRDGESTVIDEILERKNALIRPPMANLDYIFVTAAVTLPEPDPLMLDKLTAIAEFNHIRPAVVLTKCELDAAAAARLGDIYRTTGYEVFAVSCYTGEGIEALERHIGSLPRDSISAFAGASGVGKSSLMNRLFPALRLETSEISQHTQRGRHTTRSVTLYRVGGGYIADTPGFSMLDFEHFDFFTKDDLPGTFPEFAELLGTCRYTKCTHTCEDGCEILRAVSDGRIAASRHASYLELYRVLKDKHAWDR